MIKIQIVNKSGNPLPEYQTKGSAGLDISANLENDIIINPGERKLIPTGLFIAIPEGYEVQIRPRSGLALKHGLTLLNSPATIDSDYRGELQVILINLGQEAFTIQSGMRIAQMLCSKLEPIEWENVEELSGSERGIQGFGHTKW